MCANQECYCTLRASALCVCYSTSTVSSHSVSSCFDGYCSTVQGWLDWCEVDLGFAELSFIQIGLCVPCVFVLYSPVSLSSCPFFGHSALPPPRSGSASRVSPQSCQSLRASALKRAVCALFVCYCTLCVQTKSASALCVLQRAAFATARCLLAVWCSVVQGGVVCCSVLQCAAVWCGVVQCGAVWCDVGQCAAVWCSVVRCDAVWRSVVRCGTVCCNVV